MPSINVRDPLQRLAMRGALFVAEVGGLLAALLALSTVNPAYAWDRPAAAHAAATPIAAQIDDLIRAIDNGGLDAEVRGTVPAGPNGFPNGLWMSADVNDRLRALWASFPESRRAKWSAKAKRAIAAKIQKQLGARQTAAWAAWSALANW